MNWKDRLFDTVEQLFARLAACVMVGGVAYVILHFIGKYW